MSWAQFTREETPEKRKLLAFDDDVMDVEMTAEDSR